MGEIIMNDKKSNTTQPKKQQTIAPKNIDVEEWLPENIDEVDYSKIELVINTKKYQINKLSQFGNNSSIIEYKIKEFNEINLPDSVFKFNIDAYKDFEIIDLR